MKTENQKIYITHIKDGWKVSVFEQPEYLDIVCGDSGWDVAVSEDKNGKVNGFWPYYIEKKGPITRLKNPPFVPWMGPQWQIDANVSRPSKNRQKKIEILNQLWSQIPKTALIELKFQSKIKDAYPYHVLGLSASERYTFVLKGLDEIENIWNSLSSHLRNRIKRAEEKYDIRRVDDIDIIYEMQKYTLEQSRAVAPSIGLYQNLFDFFQSNIPYETIGAFDKTGQLLSYTLVLYDGCEAIYLWPCRHPNNDKNDSSRLLIWESIRRAGGKGMSSFNFEGSMLSHIEPIYRAFEGDVVPYFEITKPNNMVNLAMDQYRKWRIK